MDIECVVARAAAGDETAWRELVAAYQRLLCAVGAQIGADRWDAEDAAQETWLALWESIDTLRRPEQVKAWLCRVVRRRCVRIVVRRRAERLDGEPESFADQAGGPVGGAPAPAVDAALLHAEVSAILWSAVDGLPGRERALLRALFDGEERSYKEVAHDLGMPVGAIGPVRGRAMDRLPDRLAGAGVTVDDLHVVA